MARPAMQKVDLVIAGVGILAALATTLGVVFYEEAAGQRTVEFPETATPLSDDDSGGAGTFTFTFPAPDNATAFEGMQVTVDFTGNAGVQPSGGSYAVSVTAPDGTTCQGDTVAWSEATATIAVPDCRWAQAPNATTAGSAAAVDEAITWTDPLVIEVVVTDPSTTVPPVQGVHSYSYDVSVRLDLLTYRAQVDIPDPQGAQ